MSKSFRFNKKEYGSDYFESNKQQKNFRKERSQRHSREDLYGEDEVVYEYDPPQRKSRNQYHDER